MYAPNQDFEWLFLRLICLIFFIAFLSFHKQIKGIFGPRGIQPVGLSISNLLLVTYTGISSSLLGLLGWYPSIFLFICWVLYLYLNRLDKFYTLNNHWDRLLLEIGFYSILLGLQSPSPYYLSMVIPFFLFRFLIGGGIYKTLHPTKTSHWLALSSMKYFYEVQPVPNRVAFYMHQQPNWIVKISTFFSLIVLFISPLFIFTPYSYIGFFLIVLLQITIWITGNFPWINPLIIIVSLSLINFQLPSQLIGKTFSYNSNLFNILNGIGVFIIFMNSLRLINDCFMINYIKNILDFFTKFCVFMPYSLFGVIDEKREVIVIEGSEDGIIWKEYEFKNNPGNIFRPPSQVTPHQNRLDWNMWDYGINQTKWNKGWFVPFLACLLEGVPEVLSLMGYNPFPEKPPLYIRSKLYHYQFTDLETKRKTGQWWTRKFLRLFGHTYTLQALSPSRKKLNRRPIIVK